jgi:hypothetical protein
MKRASYITFDKVRIFEGDNFYGLDSTIVNGKLEYYIKYWDCKVMESFAKNRQYLKGKIKFSDKLELKNFILANNLVVRNFNHMFASHKQTKYKMENKSSKLAQNPPFCKTDVSGSDILVLLERKFPTSYEIHRGKIEQSKNMILTTTDKEFAERLVNRYNHYH